MNMRLNKKSSIKIDDPQSYPVYLRPLTYEDITDSYQAWLNDKEVTSFLEVSAFGQNKEDIKKYITDNSSKNNMLFAIIAKKQNIHIGNIRLGPIYWIPRMAYAGIMIGEKEYWGKGFSKYAMKLVMQHAFSTLGLEKLKLDVVSSNKKAVYLYEGLGFKKEAVLKQHFFTGNTFVDVILYGITKQEYLKHK